jgi:probable Rubsico expression protein CbbX
MPAALLSTAYDVLADLDRELVALGSVKARLREIAALLAVERLRADAGLATARPSLHMCFTGNPGTGKTTVALRMAAILHRLGYIAAPRVTPVTRADLVGEYVGHTGPKTRDVLRRAAGGVLFIDEAYYLHRPENERDYGQEAVEMLLQAMESERDRLVVIFAGYADRMAEFFRSNPGMGSRVAHHLEFPDYSLDELLAIADGMLAAREYQLGDEAAAALAAHLDEEMARPGFANGRTVRNALDRAVLRHAARVLASDRPPTRDDLATLEPDDILSTPVFADA